jgi:hypothetical protein
LDEGRQRGLGSLWECTPHKAVEFSNVEALTLRVRVPRRCVEIGTEVVLSKEDYDVAFVRCSWKWDMIHLVKITMCQQTVVMPTGLFVVAGNSE